MPGIYDRSSRLTRLAQQNEELPQIHFSRAFDKATIAFPIDGVGDLKPPVVPQLLITIDNVPDTPGETSPTLVVTPPGTTTFTVSSIDTIGDQDFYQVTLTAGTTYELGLYSFNGGPNGAGLTDPYMELYAADGTTLLVSADGGADTPYNEINSGFDVLLVYTPTTSGTFYVNARAFGNSPLTPTGDSVGDYQLFAREQDPNDPTVYTPYYEPTEPLYAIDWGSQVNKINQSARNPDGDEGPRETGNAPGTPTYNVNNVAGFDLNAILTANNMTAADIAGKNVITIYFARAGDIFPSNDPTQPGLPPVTITAVGVQQFERDAVFTALAEFEKAADVIYLEVDSRDHADFIYTSYQGTPGPGVSLLGSMSPPDESDEGLAQFNSGDERWNETNLQQGGFSFVTLIHEFGHGHGLAHPHDNGGRSGIMNGVVADGPVADYTLGDYDLNQAVFTMMSYQDGWPMSPHGNAETDVGYGYLGGLMAFDIAAIQDKYGVNEDTNTGNDVYVMKDENEAGTYYYSIWDADGVDAIRYDGARDANIDLRAASLRYEYGGGGWVSYADGIYGGFTIANSVVIEHAFGGSGNDTLIGNDAANVLVGGAGADAMSGGLGDDIYYVEAAGDLVTEALGGGSDRIATSVSYALASGSEVELFEAITLSATNAMDLAGNELNNLIIGNNGANILRTNGGNDTIYGAGGNDYFVGGNAANGFFGGLGDDTYYLYDSSDSVIEDVGAGNDRVATKLSVTLTAGSEIETLEALNLSDTDAVNLGGNEFANRVIGNAGANTLNGGGGNDTLHGLGGADTFAFTTALGANNVDMIMDFQSGTDKIALDDAVFTGLGLGTLGAEAFATGAAAQDANDRIIYNQATGQLFYDADGNGAGAAVLFASFNGAPVLNASDFTVI